MRGKLRPKLRGLDGHADAVAGHRAPPGFQPPKMRAGEVKRRCGSDGLQVRPDGESTAVGFSWKINPCFAATGQSLASAMSLVAAFASMLFNA